MNVRDTRYKAVKPREGPEYGPCMNAGYDGGDNYLEKHNKEYGPRMNAGYGRRTKNGRKRV